MHYAFAPRVTGTCYVKEQRVPQAGQAPGPFHVKRPRDNRRKQAFSAQWHVRAIDHHTPLSTCASKV